MLPRRVAQTVDTNTGRAGRFDGAALTLCHFAQWTATIAIMRMPSPEQALVDIAKLRDYILNLQHPRGRHKARVFRSVLGLEAHDAEHLQRLLRQAAWSDAAIPHEGDAYGERFLLDFPVEGLHRTATVRSIWIVRRGEYFPRLVSCYVR